ncbi:hypothetical protein CHH28_12925 [Bacterioplanes sanyensis]|uniref:Serine aminopeptidase S33 domain-containing protein n=1 Tax=Bacterioplanes sanyensis TaxID=1249553 RepID=A0A222FMB1_9GAMM|nr:alpha/beta hydrolase [Bacterioplanes sanyensis]ASP39521.1 hypothetical protein CHH28_12925 [Bacterioplanes sanyensis]
MKVMLTAVIMVVVLTVLVLLDEANYQAEKVAFTAAGNRLSGSLLMPEKANKPWPVALVVHGDGATDRTSSGYYQPYFEALLAAGIAVFSWDKPGVGASEGSWLQQSMDDRSQEVLAAIHYLRSRDDVSPDNIGVMGFSQAGWVLPAVLAQDANLAFAVFVSTAINWREQGRYLTRQRLSALGLSESDIEASLAYNQKMDQQLAQGISYQDYLDLRQQLPAALSDGSAMSPERFGFVVKNIHVDASATLPVISQPVLAVFADSDQQVDVQQSIAVYSAQLGAQFHHQVYPDADHALFKHRYFQHQPKDGLWFWLKMIVLGEEGLADGVTTDIAHWIEQQLGGNKSQPSNAARSLVNG